MHNYTLILNQIARSNIRDYFSKRISEYIDLYNNSTDIKLTKGIFIREPHVEVTQENKYVENQSFITDLFVTSSVVSPFSEKLMMSHSAVLSS